MCGRGKRDASIVVALCAMCLMKASADPSTATTTTTTTTTATAAAAATTTTTPPPVSSDAQTPTTTTGKYDDIAGNAELLKQVLLKKCQYRYTMTCLKLDVVRLIDRLGTARAYQLVPGVSLVRATTTVGNNNTAGEHQHQQQQHGGIPAEVIRSLVRGNESAEELDGFLVEKVDAYLNSLSISVKLVDSTVVENVRKLGSQMLVNVLPTSLLETTGRGKKNGMHMALWSAGTLAAIGFASLAAMSGKALMTAMLALALAAACAFRGHHQQGGQYTGKTSHYEIITKPAHYDHDHVVHGAAYSSAPYGSYARQLTADESDGGGAYHVGGRGHPLPPLMRVAVVHATAADSSGPGQPPPPHTTSVRNGNADDDDDDDNNGNGNVVGQSPYPLSPIAYIPTSDA